MQSFQRLQEENSYLAKEERTESMLVFGEVGFQAFKANTAKLYVFIGLNVVTLGCLGLFARWYPWLWVQLVRSPSGYADCTHVLANRRGKYQEVPVRVLDGATRYFEYRKQRFIFNDTTRTFSFTPAVLRHLLPSELHELHSGLSDDAAEQLLQQNGPNRITIDDVPIATMLLDKLTQLFYLFQIASVVIWLVEGYTTYAWLIFFMSGCSVGWEIYSAKRNERQLRSLSEQETELQVLRNGRCVTLPCDQLVVGDAVVFDPHTLQPDTKLPCDMVLVQGECLMNEAALTGETVPVLKLPLPVASKIHQVPLEIDKNRTNMLFGGSTILQLKPSNNTFKAPSHDPRVDSDFDGPSFLKSSVLDGQSQSPIEMKPMPSPGKSIIAIVHSTGFSTSKGELFRSILFPTDVEFKFNKDSMTFLALLGGVALVAFANRVVNSLMEGTHVFYAILNSLDLITIAVPPALPLILTVGIGFSLSRLKAVQIFCIDPERLHYAGRLDTMCWDKTGTITIPSLLFSGVHYAHEQAGRDRHHLDFSPANVIPNLNSLERVMVACHGVTRPRGEYLGHALDLETFKSTEWAIDTDGASVFEHGLLQLPVVAQLSLASQSLFIVKRFEFDAHLQRSSVIAVSKTTSPMLYVKGSPESIKELCTPGSLPHDFDAQTALYSIEGFYVIACASRAIPSFALESHATMSRSQVESDLTFLGFILFQNPIKKQAFPTFSCLTDANIQSIIITGDNALTAIHVSRQLSLVKEVNLVDKDESGLFVTAVALERSSERLEYTPPQRDSIEKLQETLSDQPNCAITGSALKYLREHDVDTLHRLMPHTVIFSRAKPDQKTWIIEWLIKSGRNVGMCGDGTNDCGALKAAHVGLALSSAEASIVAPFTSAQKQISDVVTLIREGRCALETSFVGFKYMTLYPLIQLMMSATLNQFNLGLSNNQFLFDDMVIVTLLALFSLYTDPSLHLTKSRPVDTLFSKEILISLGGQLLLCIAWFTINGLAMTAMPWFCSSQRATQFLDHSTYLPLNATLGAASYPCYPIDPELDTSLLLQIKSYENTVLWNFGHFQFVITIFALSFKSHYRLPFWTNRYFTYYVAFVFSLLALQMLFLTNASTAVLPGPQEYDSWLSLLFTVQPGIPFEFRLLQLVFTAIHAGLALGWEWYWDKVLYKHVLANGDDSEAARLL
ncbi:hypothetical protein HDU91_001541 [Kappamyces sp. JEL0680]|nr:hypothetical protein HDU91_001541 [Kappamyces sp. JEL0680]